MISIQAESIMIIKSISRALSLSLCAGLLCSNANAAVIIDSDTGLASPEVVIDFGDNLFTVGTEINTQFQSSSGVSFGPTYIYNDINSTFPPLTQGHIENINTTSQPGSIFFSLDVTAAAFSWRTLTNTTTTFAAFNDNILVEEFVPPPRTNTSLTSGRYFGFENIMFDEIRLSIGNVDRGFTLDNLQYISAVPVPAAAWLFGPGLLGLIAVSRRKS